ncbi:MAG TPA: hypothetical protein DIU49_04335 [Desulfovibrio sp.]|nr:hypothetical protein [Desulfovibrio sp.]
MMETHTPEDVFISYCTQNADKANLLLEALEELGLRCWIAPRNIVGGDTWPVAITKALQHCKIMVLVYSSASQDSVYVVNEATIALRLNKYIVPVRTEDIPVQKSLDLLLATCQWKDAFRDPAAESREIAKEIYITLKRILNEPHDDEVLRKYNAKRSGKGRKVLLVASACLVVFIGLAFHFNFLAPNTSVAVPQPSPGGKDQPGLSAKPAIPAPPPASPTTFDAKAGVPAALSPAPSVQSQAPAPAAPEPAVAPRQYASLAPPAPVKPAQEALRRDQDVNARIARFVSDYQNSYNFGGPADVVALYGPAVNFYGKANTDKASLYGEFSNYFERWQKRRSRLNSDMRIEDTSDPAVKRVVFSYVFYRERGEQEKQAILSRGYYKGPKDDRWCSSGVAVDTLTLKVLDDSIQIVGESQSAVLDKPKNTCKVIP